MPLQVCTTCGAGIKQTRGWTWINPAKLFAEVECRSRQQCPACPMGRLMDSAGLLWIGKQFYPSVAHFLMEADQRGICRRVSAIPKGFKLGETWVFLAHPEAMAGEVEGEQRKIPGVFRIFRPTRVEKVVNETMAKDKEAMDKLRKRGITLFVVPDDDPDHKGTVYDKGENGNEG